MHLELGHRVWKIIEQTNKQKTNKQANKHPNNKQKKKQLGVCFWRHSCAMVGIFKWQCILFALGTRLGYTSWGYAEYEIKLICSYILFDFFKIILWNIGKPLILT